MITLLISLCPLVFAEPGDLERAYQREFAFLQAEKSSLQSRLVEVEQDGQQRIAAAEAEAERLQGRLLRLGLEVNRADTALREAEASAWSADEDQERLRTLLFQAQEGLGLESADLPEDPAAQGQALEQVFTLAAARLGEASQLHAAPGSFFLPDGAQVEGTVLRLGEVAAWGQSERGSGVLSPAGDGRLSLVDPQPELVSALLAGQAPAATPLVLFEGSEKALAEARAKTWEDVLRAGGPIGYLILVMGGLTLGVVLFRAQLLLRQPSADALLDGVAPLLAQGRQAEALAMLPRKHAAGRLLASILERGGGREALEEAAAQSLLRETPALERLGGAILVIAAVAPLMGLLGTVTGMITTFDVITELGTGDPKMLSGGISEALVTTEFGLFVAIPGVLLGNALTSRTEAMLAELERAALRLVDLLSAR